MKTQPILVVVALTVGSACATIPDPGQKSRSIEEERAGMIRDYEVERARLAARQEREHSLMEQKHELEAAALDKALVTALNESGEDLRAVEARMEAERRIFVAASLARLEKIDARVEEIVEGSQGTAELIVALEGLGAQRVAVQQGLEALDLVSDDSWFQAQRTVSRQIGALARSVEALDRADL